MSSAFNLYAIIIGFGIVALWVKDHNEKQSEVIEVVEQHTHRTNSHLHAPDGKVMRIGGWY